MEVAEQQPLQRVTYPLFGREIGARSKANRLYCRDQLRRLKQELRTLKREQRKAPGPAEERVQAIEQEMARMKELKLQNRKQTREARTLVKQQLRELRGRRPAGNKQQPDLEPTRDPWQARLPNMHKLFAGRNPALREKIKNQLQSLLEANEKGEDEGEKDEFEAAEKKLAALVAFLDERMEKACPQAHIIDFCALEALINALGDHVASILRLFLVSAGLQDGEKQQQRSFFQAAVSESYHHDLFEKMVLLAGQKSKWKLRMHIFLPENFTVAQEEVHSHRNHFASRILHGGFSHEIWEVPTDAESRMDVIQEDAVKKREEAEEGGGRFHELYKYVYDPLVTGTGEEATRVFNLNACGKVRLEKLEEIFVGKGQSYYMHTSVLHAVTSLNGCTVTFVLNAPQTNQTSCFATYQPWKEETFVRCRFTAVELREQLSRVLNLIEEGSSSQTTSETNDIADEEERRTRRAAALLQEQEQ
ncbi:JmjC domain-containing protein [Balamuthia mandrillaris]